MAIEIEPPEGCSVLYGWDGEDLCGSTNVPVGGFCDTYWDCGAPEFEEFCFTDDELYRAFLKSRAFQLRRDYRREALTEAVRGLYGRRAFIVSEHPGVITISAGRPMTNVEKATIHLARQVLPVPPGIAVNIISQVKDVPIFGFGAGWGGMCESVWAAAANV